jgi:hypothetical protein
MWQYLKSNSIAYPWRAVCWIAASEGLAIGWTLALILYLKSYMYRRRYVVSSPKDIGPQFCHRHATAISKTKNSLIPNLCWILIFHIATMQILNQMRLTRGAPTSLLVSRCRQDNMARTTRSPIFLQHESKGLATNTKDHENDTKRSSKADPNQADSNSKGKYSEHCSALLLSWTLCNSDW